MKTEAPKIPLREVMRLSIDAVPVDPLASYPIAGVYSFGRGLLARKPIAGSETTYKVLHRLHSDDFVMSQLKAWEGALARIPPSFEGWFLSPQFPTFRPIPDLLDIGYLDWFCRQSRVWEKLRVRSRGMGARRDSVSPASFLSLEIPLPSVPEQRRIGARIEAMRAKIDEAKELRTRSRSEVDAIVRLMANRLMAQLKEAYRPVPLLSVCDFRGGSQPPKSLFRYDQAPGYVRFLQIRDFSSDDFPTYIPESPNNRMAQPQEVLVGRYGASLGKILRGKSGAYNVAICKAVPVREDLELDYLAILLSYGAFQDRLNEISRSAQAGFNKGDLREVYVCVPGRGEQRRIGEFLASLEAKFGPLKRLQAETAAELAALLPSFLDKAFKGEV